MNTRAMKTAFNLIGAIAVVLAILGVFLPLLPTTPFLLLASACFARGSTRLHAWLLSNSLFGQYLRNIEEGNDMPARAKATALVLLWASLGYSAWRVASVPLTFMLAAIGAAVTIYLLKFLPEAGRRRRAARAAVLVQADGSRTGPP